MLSRRTMIFAGILAPVVTSSLGVAPALAAKDEVYTGFFSSLAVDGYDPVAYFSEGKPVEGKAEFTLQYKGATWQFASAANLEAFKANPEQYAPQYGGYCAYAVAIGQTAKGDPHNWKIVDGKLYLNINADIQRRWEANQDDFILDADLNWPKVLY